MPTRRIPNVRIFKFFIIKCLRRNVYDKRFTIKIKKETGLVYDGEQQPLK